MRYGWLDRPQLDPADSTYSVADREVALKGALESITLLKNDGHTLPLDAGEDQNHRDHWSQRMAGSHRRRRIVRGARRLSRSASLTGIAKLVGPDTHVLYTRGLPEMNDVFWQTHWESGLKEATYPSKNFTGSPEIATLQTSTTTSRNGGGRRTRLRAASVTPAHSRLDKSGKYLVLAAASGDDHYTVSVDGKQIIEQVQVEGQHPESASIDLNAGQSINVVADYLPGFVGNRFGLGIVNESDMISAEVKQYASVADVVVVAVGFNPSTESEGLDRTFTLPWGQDALIEAAVAANPHSVVTFIGGGAIDTRRWIDKVPALIHAGIQVRKAERPSRRCSSANTIPRANSPSASTAAWEDNPSATRTTTRSKTRTPSCTSSRTDHPAVDYDIPHVKYNDKLMVGYRYWTTTGKHPLFPFGFGLSYTTFNFSNLNVPATATSGSTVPVSFDVTNTGSVEGREVAELYVSDPSAKAKRPERELKGFEKVHLAPGETKHVTLSLDARAFSYWDEAKHNWTIDPGKFVILVGDSSENTPLHADLTIN